MQLRLTIAPASNDAGRSLPRRIRMYLLAYYSYYPSPSTLFSDATDRGLSSPQTDWGTCTSLYTSHFPSQECLCALPSTPNYRYTDP